MRARLPLRAHSVGALRDGGGGEHRALLDREEAERSRPLGRALDLGCGRGQYSRELARRGWRVVGIDNVPRAVNAAKRTGVAAIDVVVGDVTDLRPAELGTSTSSSTSAASRA